MLNAWYPNTEEQTGGLPQGQTERLEIKHFDSLPAGLWHMQWADTCLLGTLASPAVGSELGNLHMHIHTHCQGGNAYWKYLLVLLNTHHTAAHKDIPSRKHLLRKLHCKKRMATCSKHMQSILQCHAKSRTWPTTHKMYTYYVFAFFFSHYPSQKGTHIHAQTYHGGSDRTPSPGWAMLSFSGSPHPLLVVPSCTQDYASIAPCFHGDVERTFTATSGRGYTCPCSCPCCLSPFFGEVSLKSSLEH